jgi:hypothetical protein
MLVFLDNISLITKAIGNLIIKSNKTTFSIFAFVLASCLVSSTLAAMAIDTTGSVTSTQWGCLATSGLEMVLGRVYTPDGTIDEVGIQNIIQAFNGANLEGYDAVFVPCASNCKNNLTSGADQVEILLI